MTEQAEAALPEGLISEWRPGRTTIVAWTLAQLPIAAVGILVYLGVATRGDYPTSGTYGLLEIAAALALILGLAALHEAVHGLLMFAFGARPEFGVLRLEGVPAGFYATAPGHRFTRRRYLVIALAPLAVLAPLGLPACLLPFGEFLAVPFGLHLAGCIGDVDIARHVLRAPSDVLVEDLRDGMRLWKIEA
jgi:hypothetical protein